MERVEIEKLIEKIYDTSDMYSNDMISDIIIGKLLDIELSYYDRGDISHSFPGTYCSKFTEEELHTIIVMTDHAVGKPEFTKGVLKFLMLCMIEDDHGSELEEVVEYMKGERKRWEKEE
jgi:hypothetical protein